MRHFVLLITFFIILSCKKDSEIKNQDPNQKFLDSVLNVANKNEIEKQKEKYNFERDSLKNLKLEKEFQKVLNAKPGETIAIENSAELNEYTRNRLKPKNEISTSNNKYEENKDFEFSDYWRKEAFKKTREYLALQIEKNKCKLVGQSVYNPNRVRFIGGKSYTVRIVCSYDCNQNYINEVIFLTKANYSNHSWRFEVIKQAHND